MTDQSDQTLFSLLMNHKWLKKSGNGATNSSISERTTAIKDFSFKKWFSDHKIYIVFLVGLVLICYLNSLGNGFVSDDKGLQDVGSKITSPGFIFSDPLSPIRYLFYAVIYSFGGLNPALLRLLNIFFHAGNVILIFLILDLLSFPLLALFAASIFAVHPLLTEAVTWVSGGPYSQYTFFFLISFLFYILAVKGKKYYYLSVLVFLTALFSSNRVMPLAFVFPLYDFYTGHFKQNWRSYIPYFGFAILWGLAYVFQIGPRSADLTAITYAGSGTYNIFYQLPYAITTYLQLLFWPSNVSFYQSDIFTTTAGTIIRYLGLLIYLVIWAWSYFKNRFLFFWLSLFIVGLALTLTPIRIASPIADRYVYLSSLGIIVFATYFLARFTLKNQVWGWLIFFIVITLLAGRTIIRNLDWKDTDTLAFATVTATPTSPRAHNLVGAYYYRTGQLQQAANEFQITVQLNPRFADAYHNLGEIMILAKKYPEVISYNQKALQINPTLYQAYESIGKAYQAQGDKKNALLYFTKAYQLAPTSTVLPVEIKNVQN